jgi:DNA (cytosine-5)-methyltransferase 1
MVSSGRRPLDRHQEEGWQGEGPMTAPPPQRGTLIDLFAGCGGGSLGFVEAGLSAVAAVEIDGDAAAAYETNVGIRPLTMDIRKVEGTELLRAAGLKPGECTLLFGCPPCQSFTTLRRGARSSRLDRLRNSLYLDYLRLAAAVQPRHIAFENVPGMLSTRWRPRFEALLEGLTDLGYCHEWAVLDAADFGVPQRRQRILVIASRVSEPVLPTATHGHPASAGRRGHVTVRSAIGSLLYLATGETDPRDPYHRARRHSPLALKRLRAIPEGGARKDLPTDLQLECHKDHNGHYDIYGRMWWDRPAPTLTTGCTNVTRGRFAHPDQDRAITLREAMLLQSFPRDAVLHGSFEERAVQVGNAIPPLLAKRIGLAVVAMEERATDRQEGAPPPAISTRVPTRSRATRTLVSSAT